MILRPYQQTMVSRAEAAAIVSRTLNETLPRPPEVKEIRLVFFDRSQLDVFVANQLFGDNCC
jgi:hypothetical protein